MKKNRPIDKFSSFISKRYLFSKREPRFASFLTFVAIIGVAIGVSALIVVLSVMSGFTEVLETKMMGFNPHITVSLSEEMKSEKAGGLKEKIHEIESIDRFITGEVIVQSKSEDGNVNALGSKVFGFEALPERLNKTAEFYLPETRRLNDGVILGHEMIYQLGTHPDFGESVQVIAPFGGFDPLGNPIPSRREYKIIGAFKSGLFEYDMKYALMKYKEAKKLLKSQARYGLHIMLKDQGSIDQVAKELESFIGEEDTIYTWSAKNKRLFAALKLEREAMSFLLSLIIIIASFSVASVILMIFFAKRRDLAVMMAMGASERSIKNIFLYYGGLIGVIGVFVGIVLGVIGCILIKESHFTLPPSYYLDYLPVSIRWPFILMVAIGGVLISLLAAYYPSKRASKTDPIEMLRWE